MRILKNLVYIFISLSPIFFKCATGKDIAINLPNQSQLIFSHPLAGNDRVLYGSGWAEAELTSPEGVKLKLLRSEYLHDASGVVFSDPRSLRVSPSGRFAVINILRVGLLGDPKDRNPLSRQYCPVVDTYTGCLLSVETGELCGGEWDAKRDEWRVVGYQYDSTKPMIRGLYEGLGANDLWKKFLRQAKFQPSLTLDDWLADSLGVSNLLACTPVTVENIKTYELISDRLSADKNAVGSVFVRKKLDDFRNFMDIKTLKIRVDRAWLYEKPDLSSQTTAYLIKGDEIRILQDKGDGWILVDFRKKNNVHVKKWIITDAAH